MSKSCSLQWDPHRGLKCSYGSKVHDSARAFWETEGLAVGWAEGISYCFCGQDESLPHSMPSMSLFGCPSWGGKRDRLPVP